MEAGVESRYCSQKPDGEEGVLLLYSVASASLGLVGFIVEVEYTVLDVILNTVPQVQERSFDALCQ